jgi:histidine triad (HIT) family protein
MSDWYCDELLSGRVEVERLFEDDEVIAFWHTKPHYLHHAVVTPKHHVASMLDCDHGTLRSVLEVASAVAAQFVAEYGGAHVVTNLGKYQDSKHFHVHVGAD